MLAARWHGAGDVRVEEVPEPGAPGVGEALIEIDCAAICGPTSASIGTGRT